MIDDKTRKRLEQLHEQENELNAEMSKINNQIVQLEKRKAKIARRVSNNMKYRNRLIFPERFNFIEDGFGSTWSIFCPVCKKPRMQVVRPGKVQCSKCG
jgi:hypothetical protein